MDKSNSEKRTESQFKHAMSFDELFRRQFGSEYRTKKVNDMKKTNVSGGSNV